MREKIKKIAKEIARRVMQYRGNEQQRADLEQIVAPRRGGHRRDVEDSHDGHRRHELVQPRLPCCQRVIHRADDKRAR